MELGGNAPFVVLDDANIDDAVAGALLAKMRNGGAPCTAANRFYVAKEILHTFQPCQNCQHFCKKQIILRIMLLPRLSSLHESTGQLSLETPQEHLRTPKTYKPQTNQSGSWRAGTENKTFS